MESVQDCSSAASESHNANCNTQSYISPIGIDTLHLRVRRFEVSKSAGLRLDRSVEMDTGEVKDELLYKIKESGEQVVGHRAVEYDLPDVDVKIYGHDTLILEITLPKMLAASNWCPVGTQDQFDAALEELDNRLRQYGITADLGSAQVCRIDLCRNAETEALLRAYDELIRRCHFPRTEQSRYEDGGSWWKNGSREVNLYAKGEKERRNPRVQRLEYRLTRAQSVKAHVGVETVDDIRHNFEALRQAYRHAVQTLFPDVESLAAEGASLSMLDAFIMLLIELQEETSTPHSFALMVVGICYLQEKGLVDQFLDALKEVANRSAASRYRRKLDQLMPYADLLSERGRTATDMLEELRGKFLR